MANEANKIEKWIKAKLAANSTVTTAVSTRIYRDVAPEGVTYPLILFTLQGSEDVNGVGTCRFLTRALYQIVIVSEDEHSTASRDAADAFDAIFQTATASQLAGDASTKFSGQRVSIVSATRPVQNTTRRHRYLGGLYQITASAV